MNVATNLDDMWTVAGRSFRSRLIVGTGKYKSFEQNAAAVEASGAEIVTVALRRVNLSDPSQPMLADFLKPDLVEVSLEDTVTVVRFSQIVENPPDLQDRLRGVGGAQN